MREIQDHTSNGINNIFSFQVTMDIIRMNEDQKSQIVDECQNRNDWSKWKEAIKMELNLLAKPKVYGLII